ncbi:hypothetical protein [Nocardia pseudovaccinii]|uniref:hypothetical protein n=1 Tax=Nocardia pseudovaccinii TaxID=189540 RepID=UPI0007A50F87|nr:hypothetical protein [Nocardia pseudovaccinii]
MSSGERAGSITDALKSGAKLSPAAKTSTTEDRSDWLTWTLKMSPEQSDHWNDLLAKLAKQAGLRVRTSGRASTRSVGSISRRDMVEALVDLAEHDSAVWNLLVDKMRVWEPR